MPRNENLHRILIYRLRYSPACKTIFLPLVLIYVWSLTNMEHYVSKHTVFLNLSYRMRQNFGVLWNAFFKGIALQWCVGFCHTPVGIIYICPTLLSLSLTLTLWNSLHCNFIIKQFVEDIRYRYSAKLYATLSKRKIVQLAR